MIVQCRTDTEYSDLSPQQQYAVIGIEADDLRLLNDAGRPYLYPAIAFEMVDDTEPADWTSEYGEDGERYAYPPELNRVGFFEDFFDLQAEAVRIFWQVINRQLVL